MSIAVDSRHCPWLKGLLMISLFVICWGRVAIIRDRIVLIWLGEDARARARRKADVVAAQQIFPAAVHSR